MKTRLSSLLVSVLVVIGLAVGPIAAQGRGYSVQVSSTPSEENAQAEVSRLRKHTPAAHYVKASIPNRGLYYRVRVGRFATQEAAKTQAELMRRSSLIREFIITKFEGPSDMAFTDAAMGSTSQAVAVVKKLPPTTPPATSNTPAKPAESAAVKPQIKPPVVPPATLGTNTTTPPASKKAEPPAVKPGPTAPPASSGLNNPGTSSNPGASNPAANTTRPPVTPPTGSTTTPPDRAAIKPNTPPNTIENTRVIGTWEPQISLTNQTLNKVFFINERVGWVVGDSGTILHTENAGRNWRRQLSGVAIHLNDIFFITENVGWALGGGTKGADLRDLQNPEEMVLLRTTDGGKTWERQTGINALGIHFVTDKKGWLVGNYGEVWRTEDGGKNWQAAASPEALLGGPPQSSDFVFAFTDVTFINEQEGWLIGNNYGEASAYVGGLFHTKDGGRTWQRVPLNIRSSRSDGAIPGVLRHINFSKGRHGVIAAEIAEGGLRRAVMLRTLDGGQTWQEQPLAVEGLASLHMVDPQTGWSVGVANRTKAGMVLYTADGGVSWNEGFKTNAALNSLHFPSPLEGWAVGARGTILHFSRSARTAPTGSN